MYQQTSKIDVTDKLTIGLMAIVLFVTGFVASLLVLAIGGAMALFVLGKAWWIRRRTEKTYLGGEYHVVRE